MSLLKAILQSEIIRQILCWMASFYIRFVFKTSQWEITGYQHPTGFWKNNKPFILAFWHGRILMMPYCWNNKVPIHMLISSHRDGQLIAKTVGHFGIKTLQGSRSKGGSAALRAMIKMIKNGESVGVTPDGPRGPRQICSEGIAHLSKMTNTAVIPCSFSVKKGKFLKSWDRFLLAKPFGKGLFIWGEPILSNDSEDVEILRKRIETSLNSITLEADAIMGHHSSP
jgi:lysophospholipid acyltransferase (LPLAT)-like uncharacterized protein